MRQVHEQQDDRHDDSQEADNHTHEKSPPHGLVTEPKHFETLRDAYASVYEALTGESYETSLNAAPRPGDK